MGNSVGFFDGMNDEKIYLNIRLDAEIVGSIRDL